MGVCVAKLEYGVVPMPAHDWTRVVAGIFHDFHLGWIQAIKIALNDGNGVVYLMRDTGSDLTNRG